MTADVLQLIDTEMAAGSQHLTYADVTRRLALHWIEVAKRNDPVLVRARRLVARLMVLGSAQLTVWTVAAFISK